MREFAERTRVSVERTQAEIGAILKKYGAQDVGYGSRQGDTIGFVEFSLGGYPIRIEVPEPDRQAFKTVVVRVKGRQHQRDRSPAQRQASFEQARRERWRALLLMLKARLVLAAMCKQTPDRAFVAELVLPNNELVGASVLAKLEAEGGKNALRLLAHQGGGRGHRGEA